MYVVDLSLNALPLALFSFLFDFQAGRGTAPVSQSLDHTRNFENKPFQLSHFVSFELKSCAIVKMYRSLKTGEACKKPVKTDIKTQSEFILI